MTPVWNFVKWLALVIRLVTFAGLLTTVAAIALAWTVTPPPAGRVSCPAPPAVISGYPVFPRDCDPRFLDPETGSWTRMTLASGDRVAAASCSPWRDEKGRFQVIGRWTSWSKSGQGAEMTDVGLIRFTYPDGEVLDRIPTEVVPITPPCWYPGTTARVVFAAGDGQLYEINFEERAPRGSGAEPTQPRPRALKWRGNVPGDGKVFLTDVALPAEPLFGGRVLVSLSMVKPPAKLFTPMQIWWLQLDASGMVIEEAGRLTAPESDVWGARPASEHRPALASNREGALTLAYMISRPDLRGRRLRIAPIKIDSATGIPAARAAIDLTADKTCLALTPLFSRDATWLACLFEQDSGTPEVERVSLRRNEASLVGWSFLLPCSLETAPRALR